MNIIVGVLTIAAAVWLRLRYRKYARGSGAMFALSLLAGLISLLTVRGASIWAELGFGLLAALVCGIILSFYKLLINRSFAAQRTHAPIESAPLPETTELRRATSKAAAYGLRRISSAAAFKEYLATADRAA